jgi:UMP-CMP kinase
MGSGNSKSKAAVATPASPENPLPPDATAEKIVAAAIPAPPEATIPPVNVEVEPETLVVEPVVIPVEASAPTADIIPAPIEAPTEPVQPEAPSAVVEEVSRPSAAVIEAFESSTKAPYQVVFVLGGPGSGKGTNCAKIKSTFGYEHLSAGDLLRAERQSGSQLADMINGYIVEGKIVPAQVTVDLLRKAMDSTTTTNKFLVDGFPRDLDNLHCWESEMDAKNITIVEFLLFLDCPNEIVVERLLERGKTSGRNDDNLETIQKRLQTYEQQTKPIVDHFAALGKVRTVDSNRSEDEVFADVSSHFTSTA